MADIQFLYNRAKKKFPSFKFNDDNKEDIFEFIKLHKELENSFIRELENIINSFQVLLELEKKYPEKNDIKKVLCAFKRDLNKLKEAHLKFLKKIDGYDKDIIIFIKKASLFISFPEVIDETINEINELLGQLDKYRKKYSWNIDEKGKISRFSLTAQIDELLKEYNIKPTTTIDGPFTELLGYIFECLHPKVNDPQRWIRNFRDNSQKFLKK